MNNNIRVSIIITSYNRSKYIGQAIESCLSQDYSNLEIIITDNCSSDNTIEIVKPYLRDSRVIFSRNDTNIGMIPNFTKGIYELATGDFVTFLSSDDFFTDSKFISKATSLIYKYPNIAMVLGKTTLGMNDDFESKPSMVHDSLFQNEYHIGTDVFNILADKFGLGFGACLLNRKLALDLGIFKTDATSADFYIIFKMLLNGNIALVNSNAYCWRHHTNNTSGSLTIEQEISNLRYVEDIYRYAYSNNKLPISQLKSWRFKKLKRRLMFLAIRYKINSPIAFKENRAKLKNEFPSVFKAISNDISFQFVLLLTTFKLPFLLVCKLFLKPGEYLLIKNLYSQKT